MSAIPRRRIPATRRFWAVALAIGAVALYIAFAGQWTLPHNNDAPFFERLNDFRAWIDANRNSNPILVVLIVGVRTAMGALFTGYLGILQVLTWPGLTVIAGGLGLLVGGRRLGGLLLSGFLSFGVLGLWDRSIETLAMTFAAVTISLLIGIPVGIQAGRSVRFYSAIRPILDVMQIMPTYAYLAPFALIFLIGPTTGAIVTLIYAIPPAVRITALGIRGVAPATVEAATSLGATRRQLLAKVQLPMARRTIVLGINQTIMMALSMVVITALVDTPGLGKNLIKAIQISNVGVAFDAGLAIVIMAIMLDRLTTRASERVDPARAGGAEGPSRQLRLAVLVASVAAVLVGTFVIDGGQFPTTIGFSFREPINAAVSWVSLNLYFATEWAKNAATYGLINPIQYTLTNAPWWLVGGVISALAVVVGGIRPALITALCLLGILGIQLWEHSMQTLTLVLVATLLTLVIGLVLGILSARSDVFSAILRPVLDAAQTMPAFVYLLPAVALFGATRFSGIVAAIIFAVPPVIRLVEIGIRTVPATVREAGVSAGATASQLLRKVELPLALPALLVATNQGIILVLSMVVVGGLIGAGGLGYDVVAGFVRRDFFGEGLAAAFAIVLLGIMLDRITQSAGSTRARDPSASAGDDTATAPAAG
ncbi:MAG: ABC transporter permease subunit [Chloroflexi bacterium]|nr:ABC transporter permease subunit [Chloroflexota bacterium]